MATSVWRPTQPGGSSERETPRTPGMTGSTSRSHGTMIHVEEDEPPRPKKDELAVQYVGRMGPTSAASRRTDLLAATEEIVDVLRANAAESERRRPVAPPS